MIIPYFAGDPDIACLAEYNYATLTGGTVI
jgi:hypothetical protein